MDADPAGNTILFDLLLLLFFTLMNALWTRTLRGTLFYLTCYYCCFSL